MTREKYESLPLSTLKEVAKTRGLRGISTMKKADLIDLMLDLHFMPKFHWMYKTNPSVTY